MGRKCLIKHLTDGTNNMTCPVSTTLCNKAERQHFNHHVIVSFQIHYGCALTGNYIFFKNMYEPQGIQWCFLLEKASHCNKFSRLEEDNNK